MCVGENLPNFEQLKALMITKERNMGGSSKGRGSKDSMKAFYSNSSRM